MKIRYIMLVLLLMLASFSHAYIFGKNKVNANPSDWSVLKTMHFDIYFPQGEDDFGKTAALMAEETYYTLREDLKYPIESRIPIIFYGSKTEFQDTNIIYPLLTEGVGGFTESLRNRVVIPFDGSYSNLEQLLVHELTHAYINALDSKLSSGLYNLRPTAFPFWFSEGMPEFLSIGGEDDYNNMFILDMVVNGKLPKLRNIGGYYAYRLGESFLTFIADTYGRDKVSEYYFTLRAVKDLDNATKKVFGLDFEELESRWNYQLKRDFYPYVNSHKIPAEAMEQRTDSEEDGSYFNFVPRFSPNGDRYVYFSSAGARYSIWMAGLHGLSRPKKILTGESTGRLQEFHYFRSNLSWFPDNKRVAFSAKAAAGDRIHILDVDAEKIVQTLELQDFDALYELDVSPDGGRVVFAGQKGMQCDIYQYDLDTKELSQLTDSPYNDKQPRYAPDGKSIVFSSERSRDEASKRKGFFADISSDVFSLDLQNKEIQQHTYEKGNCDFPMFDASGTKLLYIAPDNGVGNVFALDLEKPGKAQVTDILSGVYAADISQDGHLLVTNYFDTAWDIYFTSTSLDTLAFEEYPPPTEHLPGDDLMRDVDLAQLDYFGVRDRMRPRRINPAAEYDLRSPLLGEVPPFEYTAEDSLQLGLMQNYSHDERPQEIETDPPRIEPYKTRFSLDSLWGGFAYSSGVGTIGYVELSLSDIMGNHGIGINAGVAGKLEESNLLLSYLYLKNRIDYGIGIYNLNDEFYYREYLPGPDDYYRYRQRQTGLYLMARYPFSRFLRLELESMFYQRGRYFSYWDWNTEDWNEYYDEQANVISPGLKLVHDNALYGSTGPLVGWRAMYNLSTTLADGKLEYLTNYLDWRSYTLFSKRYAIALRTIAGISLGETPQRFNLYGYYGVRGYEGDQSGEKKAVVSAELRFPFFEYISMAFPVPLTIPNIRGSVFADLGTVFDDFEDFRGVENGRLEDLKLSYGFGPRLDLGYVILRLDIAWLTDLTKSSKPTYFLSLSEDF
ncbi:MAG: BamA/TamA family outer membrane protein [Candidatus Syntrophosphaera sp.]